MAPKNLRGLSFGRPGLHRFGGFVGELVGSRVIGMYAGAVAGLRLSGIFGWWGVIGSAHTLIVGSRSYLTRPGGRSWRRSSASAATSSPAMVWYTLSLLGLSADVEQLVGL
jgi:hypothetical protein